MVLFVGESPPKKSFFYSSEGSVLGRATSEAFERVFRKAFRSHTESLAFFKSCGCHLDDLFPGEDDRGKSVQRASPGDIERAVKRLAERIREYRPEVVIVVLKRVCGLVKYAVQKSSVNATVHCLSFPRRDRRGYVDRLAKILAGLRSNNVLACPG